MNYYNTIYIDAVYNKSRKLCAYLYINWCWICKLIKKHEISSHFIIRRFADTEIYLIIYVMMTMV